MTVEELLRKQTSHVGAQLGRVFGGLTEQQADMQAIPAMMTAREQAEHLCECYEAVKTMAAGGKHEWGTYSSGAGSWAELLAMFDGHRSAAVDAALAGEDGSNIVSGYVVEHDAYHVGQLVSLRSTIDPSWDAYSVYG